MPAKPFDRRFFDKWYRGADHRFRAGAALERHAMIAIAAAEYLLERRVRRVLDVGCGEGEWRAVLRAMRPRAAYTGIDPSEYAVRRFGKRRNIELGGFGTLGDRDDIESFDLVLCIDALHYAARADVARGARVLGKRLHGVVMLHAFARGDDIEGDVRGLTRRPVRFYRETFRAAGLTPIGMACWVGRPLAGALSALER
jgi:SAM-dependent methyltransferase